MSARASLGEVTLTFSGQGTTASVKFGSGQYEEIIATADELVAFALSCFVVAGALGVDWDEAGEQWAGVLAAGTRAVVDAHAAEILSGQGRQTFDLPPDPAPTPEPEPEVEVEVEVDGDDEDPEPAPEAAPVAETEETVEPPPLAVRGDDGGRHRIVEEGRAERNKVSGYEVVCECGRVFWSGSKADAKRVYSGHILRGE